MKYFCLVLCLTNVAVRAGEISYTGIRLTTVGEELAAYLGLSDAVRIRAVDPGSPAATAGLKPYDVLVSWDGAPVTEIAQLAERMRAAPVGKKITAKVLRRGLPVDLAIVPAARERQGLSPATKKILGRLKDLLTVTYYVSKDPPPPIADMRDETQDLLSELKRAAPSHKVRVTVIDPTDEARRVARERQLLNEKAREHAKAAGGPTEDHAEFPWVKAQPLAVLLKGTFPHRMQPAKVLPSHVLVIGSSEFCKDYHLKSNDGRFYRDNCLFLKDVLEAFSLGDELFAIGVRK
jgi:hypothetical protein